MDIKETTMHYLIKENKRLLINLDRAKARPNVTQDELDALRKKLEINGYLMRLVNIDIEGE